MDTNFKYYLGVWDPRRKCRKWQRNLNILQIPTEGRVTRYLTNNVQNCHSHLKQEKSEKPLEPGEPKEIRLLNLMWYPQWDPRTEKGN